MLHYEIIETIGRGGMGVVFRAHDERLGRDVALKCPWPRLSTDDVGRRRFLRESRAASQLSHPTIVSVFEVFEDRDLPWIAMELVEGRALSARLASGEPLPTEAILKHAEALTDALRSAHEKGILHRDLKPGNVLIDREGRARLTDFGLARFFETEGGASNESTAGTPLTEEGRVVGTLAYMAPEQLLGGPSDPRSDIFSLGVIVYEMCTGRAAFVPSGDWDVPHAVLNREPVAIARLNYEVPRGLERIVRKAMAKRPEERYQHSRDMLSDIRALRRKIAAGEADPEEDPQASRPKKRVTTVVLGFATMSSLAIAAWTILHDRPRTAIVGTPRQLTTAPGTETDPAVAPNGMLVAYASDESGNLDIWIVDARGGNPKRLTDDPSPDEAPAWFPDGSAIAFTSQRSGKLEIWRVPALGGTPALLVPDAADPAISPDGRRIAFRRPSAGDGGRIYVAAISEPQAATPLTVEGVGFWGQFSPAWSPDGTRIAFRDYQHLWVADAAGGGARQLTDGPVADFRPAWTADGRHVVFGSYREGTTALWSIPASGGRARRLTHGSGSERLPSFDRRGTRMAFTTFIDDRDIAIKNLETGAVSLIRSQGNDWGAAIAPDGSRVVFISERWGKSTALASMALDGGRGGGPVSRLTEWSAALPRFSPDGRWLAFWRARDEGRDVWVMPSTGGEAIRFDSDPAVDRQPAWSPRGDRLAFVSERGGRTRIWTASIAEGRRTGPASPISTGGGKDLFPEWSPDGTTVAFIRATGTDSDVWLADAQGGAERRLTSGAGAQLIRWLDAPHGMLVSGTWGGPVIEARSVDAATGEPRTVAPLFVGGTDPVAAYFDLDRRARVLATSIQERRGDIWLIEYPPGSF